MRNVSSAVLAVAALASLAMAGGAAAQPKAPTPRPAVEPPPVEKPPEGAWSALHHAAASPPARRLVAWVAATNDNGDLPYIVIDKKAAVLLVFDPAGKLLGASPALIGVASGDDSTPGIGSKDLSKIGPAERTTPAGRFMARYGTAPGGEKVLWVDWETAVAVHAVVTGNKRERRVDRLRSPSPADNRITYGCINVPTDFYRERVQPVFAESGGVVYVLPDTKTFEAVFPKVALGAERGGKKNRKKRSSKS